jgi:hypothetical protein
VWGRELIELAQDRDRCLAGNSKCGFDPSGSNKMRGIS